MNSITVHDTQGNEIIRNGNDLLLGLSGERRTRKIGSISNGVLYVRRRRSHIMDVNKSYGFNHHILSNARMFDKVNIKDDYGIYELPVSVILDKGDFLFFKKQGFEKQIFLPLDEIYKYKI